MNEPTPNQLLLLDRIAGLLDELYDPSGVLLFWSSKIGYLENRRPCDLVHNGDWNSLEVLADRLDAMCDGNFL